MIDALSDEAFKEDYTITFQFYSGASEKIVKMLMSKSQNDIDWCIKNLSGEHLVEHYELLKQSVYSTDKIIEVEDSIKRLYSEKFGWRRFNPFEIPNNLSDGMMSKLRRLNQQILTERSHFKNIEKSEINILDEQDFRYLEKRNLERESSCNSYEEVYECALTASGIKYLEQLNLTGLSDIISASSIGPQFNNTINNISESNNCIKSLLETNASKEISEMSLLVEQGNVAVEMLTPLIASCVQNNKIDEAVMLMSSLEKIDNFIYGAGKELLQNAWNCIKSLPEAAVVGTTLYLAPRILSIPAQIGLVAFNLYTTTKRSAFGVLRADV